MKQPIPIYIAVEDDLSETILRKILPEISVRFYIGRVFRRGGYGYLKKNAKAFNNASKYCPFLLLTDLDQNECPPELIKEWLPIPKHKHFIFRVAVREVESWMLGDGPGLGKYLRLKRPIVIPEPESIKDPKKELLSYALKSPSRLLRDAIVYHDIQSGVINQGADYNGFLGRFVSEKWNVQLSKSLCPSLEKLFAALIKLESEFEYK